MIVAIYLSDFSFMLPANMVSPVSHVSKSKQEKKDRDKKAYKTYKASAKNNEVTKDMDPQDLFPVMESEVPKFDQTV